MKWFNRRAMPEHHPSHETNPYAAPANEDRPVNRKAPKEPETFVGAMGQGVVLGVKWMTFMLGPIAALMLLGSIGATVYELMFDEKGLLLFTDPDLRWATLKMLGTPFGFYLVCCMWGIVAGELVCPMVYLVRRTKRKRMAARANAAPVSPS